MIGTKPTRLNFSPALPCVECRRDTCQGRLYPMRSLVWQLFPLCDEHIDEPPDGDEPGSLSSLRCRINEQLAEIQQLQRRKRHMARVYAGLRRHHVPLKTLRALRWKLNQAEKLQAEAMEVQA
jgi:hypothetical protein